jgi:antitoxin (DNA-binding transcriptional repressor) of toxin-antitoxin stability system
MRTVKIGELKAKLSAHIQYVKNGEEVLILDRNTPVARLVAVAPVEKEDARRNRLISTGVIIPAKVRREVGRMLPEPTGPMISDEVMERVWREEREAR